MTKSLRVPIISEHGNIRSCSSFEEHDLEGFIEADIPEPEGDEAKEKHKKSLIKAKRIIVDSIKDHLIPMCNP